MKNDRGFTLLEVVIVMVVISVLATMVWPRYLDYTEKTRGAEAREVLYKSYAGYQRLITDGERVWGSEPASWTRLGMSDPNANANRYFDYSPVNNWGGNFNGVRADRRGDNTKWLQISVTTGVITKSAPY